MKNQKVEEAAMAVVSNEDGNEVLRAFIVKKNLDMKEQEIIDYVSRFASVTIEGGVEFIAKLPRNPFGKIVRKLLLEISRVSTRGGRSI